MKLYMVTANVHIKDKDGWIKTLDIPTFFLSKDIQGIVSVEHARKIVESVLNPTADSNIRVSATIVECEEQELPPFVAIVPRAAGGVQIEGHTHEQDWELEVDEHSNVVSYFNSAAHVARQEID